MLIPAVLVVADEQPVRIGGQGGLAGARQAEEQSGVLAAEIGVGRAVHGGNAPQGQVVVHHGEDALFISPPYQVLRMTCSREVMLNSTAVGNAAQFLVISTGVWEAL